MSGEAVSPVGIALIRTPALLFPYSLLINSFMLVFNHSGRIHPETLPTGREQPTLSRALLLRIVIECHKIFVVVVAVLPALFPRVLVLQ